MSRLADNIDATATALKTGPFSDMRAATQLTAEDLRAGAERLEREAAARRTLAERIDGRTVTAAWAHAQVRELIRDGR